MESPEKETAKEKYERVVLTLARKYFNDPEGAGYHLLEESVESSLEGEEIPIEEFSMVEGEELKIISRVFTRLFLLNEEELKDIRKIIRDGFWEICVTQAEDETDYDDDKNYE